MVHRRAGRDRPPPVHARNFQHDVRQQANFPAGPRSAEDSGLRLWIRRVGDGGR